MKAIGAEIRSWNLHLRSDKRIEDLSRMFNPVIRGWLQYYGRFYRSALYPPMRQLDRSLARWPYRKYKKLRGHLRRATHWVARISRRDPKRVVLHSKNALFYRTLNGDVCRHQNGPLGEGRIIDGCVTCPWHGYQYDPETGASPPPFTDKVATYQTRVRNGRVFVHPCPLAAGTRVEPSLV